MEPYVYICTINNEVFLYNTLDGNYLKSREEEIYKFFVDLKEDDFGVIAIEENTLKNSTPIRSFINKIRELFMGDIIDSSLTQNRPIQLMPILNLQSDINRLQKDPSRSVGENIMIHLHEIVFFMESPGLFLNKFYPTSIQMEHFVRNEQPLTVKSIVGALEGLNTSQHERIVNFVMKDFSTYPDMTNLMDMLNSYKFKVNLFFHYTSDLRGKWFEYSNENKIYTICVDFPLKENLLKNIINAFDELNMDKKYSFQVTSKEELCIVETIIEKYNIDNYVIVPIYTEINIRFFEEFVYLTEEDIISKPVSMKEIFIHQSLNIDSFGKIFMTPLGDVYSNVFFDKLGNIDSSTLLELIYEEFKLQTSWFRLRDKAPCINCNLRWLCPTPSVYEILIKKNNLCHLF